MRGRHAKGGVIEGPVCKTGSLADVLAVGVGRRDYEFYSFGGHPTSSSNTSKAKT